jgi:hypothetical protein
MPRIIALAASAAFVVAPLLPFGCGGRSAGQRDGSAGGASPTASCIEVCDQRRTIPCGNASHGCGDTCDAVVQLPTSQACEAEADAQRSCRLSLSGETFQCVDGTPIAGESCITMDDAFLACLLTRRGEYGACERVCELGVALSCANAADVADCPENCSNVSRLGACEDEALAWYRCVAKRPPEELRCQANIIKPPGGACEDELALFTACRP